MLLSSTEVNDYKSTLFMQQNGICPLCNQPLGSINESHLDHDHALTGGNAGKCRGLLHAQCNLYEGIVRHKFSRAGLTGKIELGVFLRNLSDYLLTDHSDKPYHPKFFPDLVKKFGKQTRKYQKETLETLGVECGISKESDIKLYRKKIKNIYAQ